ncbi:RNA polymerase sigma factor SigY [Caldicellulosiruptor changbaiensis]|uniref:RNA polymerase sigma factor n=1 Tax=Caldicellulosiruptor changbaiensis TaxID=1222016 RepID=A0A3T0D4S9_9FIRM|nr:RNA polymerase sigma factor SigY [Caldicellulosiruptor changbaiensis]AZT90044.1 RNA polymerase sigma factor SigY [Caldicellulosiruptor changbaiensis]
MDEKRLIDEAKKGNKEALCKLIENNLNILSGFVIKMTADYHLAQDVVQETLLKAIINIDKFSPDVKFSTWLIKISINVYKSFLRKNKRYTYLDGSYKDYMQDAEHAAISNSEYKDICKAILSLDYKFRAVFVLKHFYGYKYKEIAKILNCPIGTVRSRLHFAIKFLVKELEKKGVLESENKKE